VADGRVVTGAGPPQAPTLSHLWWEDVVYPKLFPRNQPGGTEWKTLKMQLTKTLHAATEGNEATAVSNELC
jgi:hypothetical protein